MKILKKLAIISAVGCFLIALPFSVYAVEKTAGQSIYVGADEIIEGNFIRAGNTIDVNGSVNGDVIVAGNIININGPVAGDVMAAGNTIKISGPVGGSIRVLGSTVIIDNEVERSVWAAGSSVSLDSDSKVGWDVYIAGAALEIKGPIGRNVWAGGASLIIDSKIEGNVNADIDESGQIVLYPQAKIGGELKYKAARADQLVLKEGAQVAGETIYKVAVGEKLKSSVFQKFFNKTYSFFTIISLFTLIILGLVAISLVPKKVLEVREEMIKHPGPSIGWGVVYLLLTPVLLVVLLVTIIGIPLALIIFPFYIISLYFAKVLAGFVIGLLIVDQLAKDKKYKGSLFWPLLLGLVIIIIVTSLPIIGWLIKLGLICWALGAIIKVKRENWKEYS